MTTEAELNKENKIDLSKAVLVADRVALRDVRVVKSGCLLKPSGIKGPYKINLNQEVDIQINREKKTVVVLPSFKLFAYVIEDIRKDPDFEISAVFALTYTIDKFDDLDKEDFKAFGYANGIYNAWPYWREFTQNMTSRMGVPPLTIPVFRLSSLKKDEVKNASGKKVQKKMSKKKTVKKKSGN